MTMMNLPANARFCGTLIAANLVLLSALSATAMAQSSNDRAELERASRVAEALRQISVRGQSRSPGYYSDWQVKGDRIPVWSKQCIGRSITPEEFDANQATAGGIVTCIVRGMMRQEILTTRNDESLAVRRVAAWWVTGDSNQLNTPVVANYTQQVLSAYQPRAAVIYEPPTATPVTPPPTIPAPVMPIPAPTLPPIAPTPVATAPITPTPVAAGPTPTNPTPVGQVVPAQELPPIVKPPVAAKPAEKPPEKPAEKPVEKPQEPAATPKDKTPTAIKSNGTTFYDRYMQVGYVASRAKDYRAAITAFRRALDERPGDSFAQKAIENMEAQLAKAPKP
jgi:hypothetical protein